VLVDKELDEVDLDELLELLVGTELVLVDKELDEVD
jgi:hypothetical protein